MASDFQSVTWRLSYRTSAMNLDGEPTDILHEFYIPALRLASTYDRVAGYFRSSSLAAASQGYTSFLDRDGRMRLIVGTDLDSVDVTAILAGDEARLSHALLKELEAPDTWEEAVRDGVTLLSFMVASGKLEVRVAVRKNAITGEPMVMEAADDGYVHEKWFVMGDKNGNHIYGSGSLNESKTALVYNAENIDIHCDWEGGSDEKRVRLAQADFERLWNNDLAYMEVLTLPEAVRERLVQFSANVHTVREIDGTQKPVVTEPSPEEVLCFAVLRDAPKMPGGEFLGMYTAPVEPWPHQEIVSHRLVETWPYSYLLCDEVGLGKTIEAALAIRSLVLSGSVGRVLIVAPASLTSQWQRELAQKAMLPFARTTATPRIRHEYIFPSRRVDQDNDLYSPTLNIISSGLVSRKERADALKESTSYDIVLVDEAHYARRKDPKAGTEKPPSYGQLYTAISESLRKKARSLWLATATPMQIDPIEVYDLLKLTNRVASYQWDPTVTMRYFSVMGKLVAGKQISMEEWRFIGQSYHQLEAADPYLWNLLKVTCEDSRNRRVLKELPFAVKPPRKTDRKFLPRPLFAASPLSRVMMRHTRQILEIYRDNGELKSNLATRHVLPLKVISFTKEEAAFYRQLEEYCIELTRQISKANSQFKQMMYFYLNFLQLRFASSLYAIQMTLRRRLHRVRQTLLVGGRAFESKESLKEYLEQLQENDELGISEGDIKEIAFDSLLKNRREKDLLWERDHLEAMLDHIEKMTEVPSKIKELLQALEGRRIAGTQRFCQTVLFTRFLDSLRNIRNYLAVRMPDMRVGIYSGQFAVFYDSDRREDQRISHEEIKRLFLAGDIDLLLCTDAAAEGLNLQTADMLINYDMGWNPMKIEQRIGRIDRIGQKHKDISVLNLCYAGSAEETVYGRLLDRLREANLVVGVQQISMLPVGPAEFRGLADHSLTEEQVLSSAKSQLEEQQKANASMEMSAEEQYTIYNKMSAEIRQKIFPATLQDLWNAVTSSAFLKTFGAAPDPNGKDLWVCPPHDGFPPVRATIRREVVSGNTEFMTWGNPKIDRIVSSVAKDTEKHRNCIRRISVVTGTGRETVGYLVATRSGAKLITDYAMLEAVRIDGSASLSEEDIALARKELVKVAAQRSAAVDLAARVEKLNLDYATLHFNLIQAVAVFLLQNSAQSGEEHFWTAIRNIENNTERKQIILPSSGFSGHENEMLFAVQFSADKMYIPPNDLILQSAVEFAKRTANGMKITKSELLTEDVLRRMMRTHPR